MSSPGQVAGTAQEQAAAVGETTKQQAGHVAGSAADAAGRVAGTASEQAGQVVGEAKAQIDNVIGEARREISAQADQQASRLTGALRSLCGELANMAESAESGGAARSLVREASDRGRKAADFLESRGPGGLVEELRGFARRRPGAFLAAAALAGFAAGRLGKAASGGAADETAGGDYANGSYRSAYAAPTASLASPTYGDYDASGMTASEYPAETTYEQSAYASETTYEQSAYASETEYEQYPAEASYQRAAYPVGGAPLSDYAVGEPVPDVLDPLLPGESAAPGEQR